MSSSHVPELPNGLQHRAQAMQWAWGDDLEEIRRLGPFNLILLSDVLYREDIVSPLVSAVSQLLAMASLHTTTCLMAYSLRNSAAETRFKVEASKLGIKVERVVHNTGSPASLKLQKVVHLARLYKAPS
mmetsp:Transcript_37614/g.106252  ORF Transcript_37614/g.106252 Transcript_37614/m.106252 type:complete len:129 (-) Transcript_37614:319-705(-)